MCRHSLMPWHDLQHGRSCAQSAHEEHLSQPPERLPRDAQLKIEAWDIARDMADEAARPGQKRPSARSSFTCVVQLRHSAFIGLRRSSICPGLATIESMRSRDARHASVGHVARRTLGDDTGSACDAPSSMMFRETRPLCISRRSSHCHLCVLCLRRFCDRQFFETLSQMCIRTVNISAFQDGRAVLHLRRQIAPPCRQASLQAVVGFTTCPLDVVRVSTNSLSCQDPYLGRAHDSDSPTQLPLSTCLVLGVS